MTRKLLIASALAWLCTAVSVVALASLESCVDWVVAPATYGNDGP